MPQTLTTSILRRLGLLAGVGALMISTACAKGAPSPSAPSSGGGNANVSAASALQFCADEVNKYRALAGLPTLARSADLEAFAQKAAEYDAAKGVPHQFFLASNGGGIAKAENQLLLWKGYALDNVITLGMQQMWAEGPGGSHYHVLTGNYSEVGCGVYQDASGISVSQDFR
jgi:uncharacterized protein YkwD